MIELTEQQEQEMIDRAKTGDPEANYQMSLWALDQAMAEPEEERWNRLAAKCLVKAAEAGYAPAKAKMDELLKAAEAHAEAAGAGETGAVPASAGNTGAVAGAAASAQFGKVAGQAGAAAKKAGKAAGQAAVKAGKALASGTSALTKKAKERMAQSAQARAEKAQTAQAAQGAQTAPAGQTTAAPATAVGTAPAGGSHAGKKSSSILPDFSQWDDAKWKKMQIACVIVCVVLAILIAILIISGNRHKSTPAADEGTTQIPAAVVADTTEPNGANGNAANPADGADADGDTEVTAAPTAAETSSYPDQEVRDEIQAAALDVYPEDGDYVEEAKTATVSVSSLNMRSGPGTNYNIVGAVFANARVDVYANKNGWALIKNGDVWGWCSYDYLAS